jgi:hypothetical protein
MNRTGVIVFFVVCILLFNIPIVISNNNRDELIPNSSPVVKILEPEPDGIHYTRTINITFNATDDKGIYIYSILITSPIGASNEFTQHLYPEQHIEVTKNREIYPGWNTITVTAYDQDNNSGNKTISVYYNTSFDIYNPWVWVAQPFNEITLFGESIFKNIEVEFPIVIGDFFFTVHASDHEHHLATIALYLDDNEIYREEYVNNKAVYINHNYQGFLIGFHTIKAEAFDSYRNSAIDEKECFVINFR